MAIRWVINGYFRSGTTFLWEKFREATNGDVLCLYEPFHPGLPVFLENDGLDKSGRRLHQLDLWSDYLSIPSGQRKLLLKRHPNRSGNCSWNRRELTDYLQILHTLNKDVMIQANRFHYDLNVVSEMTGARIVHVVRNPVEVFHSIRYTYLTNAGRFRGFARRLAYPFRGSNIFETAAWVNRAMTVFPQLSTALQNKPKGLLSYFVPAWVCANYTAIQSVSANQGVLCAYEDWLRNPVALTKVLQHYLGVPFSVASEDVKGHRTRAGERDWTKFYEWVERWGIDNEWKAIKSAAEELGDEWR